MTDTPILELKGVSKSFGAVQALFEVDFHVSSGEVMALVGDNGAGKSTLIKCIAGIYSIDSGDVLFEGERVNLHGPKDSARLGIEVKENGLRHAFISHRVAQTNDIAKVADEAGTSVSKIRKHYFKLVTKKEATAYFSIEPTNLAQMTLC